MSPMVSFTSDALTDFDFSSSAANAILGGFSSFSTENFLSGVSSFSSTTDSFLGGYSS